ncbi:DUF916 domain-containing protein [Microbacterium sp. 4R-513]|uniref:WxL protein peptidoglycan domain-containing protein n=1 Tax=Microbacterium sp. 4R-513 TaxID=2567934 RepID=UPI0013E18C85|nr:DUF916 domain-containing protein [Microbacterium sp. 4R-513]QIG39635.1 DUF916 domain-containing protein [Microbacterium sp. 4R-513]
MLHLTRRPSALTRTLAVLAAAVALVLPAAPALAADDPPATPEVRWSVSPADANGPDGRRSAEHEVDPGATVDDYFAVRNVGDSEVTFQLTAADGYYTRTGRFDILAADKESKDSGTWIAIPETVTVPAGETAVIPYSVTVPERAEPGDHAAGITASVLSVQSAEDGTSLGVESRVGFRVLTRVKGEITPAASIGTISPDYETSWNPLKPGELNVTFDVSNDGNTRLLAQGTVEAGGQKVAFPAEGESQQELLPGDVRTLTVVVDGVWPLFVVPTTVTLDATVLTMDGSTDTLAPVQEGTVAWAIPWPQLIILAGIVLIVLAILWNRIRSRRRLESLLADAREEGRKAAEAPVVTP